MVMLQGDRGRYYLIGGDAARRDRGRYYLIGDDAAERDRGRYYLIDIVIYMRDEVIEKH